MVSRFLDGRIIVNYPDGLTEVVFPDSTTIKSKANPDGQISYYYGLTLTTIINYILSW